MKKKQLIGILNCTPDSYFEKGRFLNPDEAAAYALKLFDEGADILDIGGESTSPQAAYVAEDVELERVLPVIKKVRAFSSKPLSIDTYKPKVAEKALSLGVDILNDITGFAHEDMRILAGESGAKLILMHMPALPHQPCSCEYPKGVLPELIEYFKRRVDLLLAQRVDPSKIILDPGIGGGSFGKTPEQSLEIIKHLPVLCSLGFPILISLSRKSFLQKILSKPASEILSTTIALNTMSLLSGASYIRVHDVGAHRDVLTVLERLDC